MEAVQKLNTAETESTGLLSVTKQQNRYLVSRGAVRMALIPGAHYGPPWPGSDKDSLLLAGAEAVNKIMGVHWGAPVVEKEIWDFDRGFFYFRISASLIDDETGRVVGHGAGSACSHEEKFRFRNSARKCPDCNSESIMKSKYPDRQTGDIGFYCNKNKGGCGASFNSKDEAILSQDAGRTENPNLAGEIPKIEAIAIKRAQVKATRTFGCLSATFSQDADDYNVSTVTATVETVDAKTGEVIEAEVVQAAVETQSDGAEREAFAETKPGTPAADTAALRAKLVRLIKALAQGGTSLDGAAIKIFDDPGMRFVKINEMVDPVLLHVAIQRGEALVNKK